MKEIYSWKSWFRELAQKIANEDEEYLTKRAKQVTWGINPSLLQYGDEGIDPFSFFYFLASKNTRNQRMPVYSSVHEIFEFENSLPDTGIDDYYIFPTPSPNSKILFHDGEDFDPDLLWHLFKQTVENDPIIDQDNFKKVLDIKNVSVAKLTQTLFLINPAYFLVVDNSIEVLSKVLSFPKWSGIEKAIKKDGGYEEYLSVLKRLKEVFPGCQPYEINMSLYLQKSNQGITRDSNFFQISTMAHGSKEDDHWDIYKKNNYVYTGGPGSDRNPYPLTEPKQGDIVLVRTGLSMGKAIGIVYKNDYIDEGIWKKESTIHVLWINKSVRNLSMLYGQIPGFSKVDPLHPWGLVYLSFKEAYKSSFDLIEKWKETFPENGSEPDPNDLQTEADTMEHSYPLNQILCGPPGTGKTWNTVNHAVAIIEGKSLDKLGEEDRTDIKRRFDKLKEAGQIAMVTFHQNFTYEDFIEGIRPVLKEDESQDVQYKLSEGIFRMIADQGTKNRSQSEQTSDQSWDMDKLLQAFAESIDEKLESGEEIRLFPSNHTSGATIIGINWLEDGEFNSFRLGGTVQDHKLNANLIKRDHEAFYKGEITSPKGIKPTQRSSWEAHGLAKYYFPLLQKIKRFHDKEWQPKKSMPVEKQNYVLIIDEINRGNIAKIFGELITLIEPSKRLGRDDETTVILPYSKEQFGVPDNLYIIGTMNTADRSIALLDTALRRRFEFIEMMPNSSHDGINRDIKGVDCQKLLDAMNKRICFLFDREHQIGHTYFIGVDDMDSLESVFKNRIISLLQEYFYDNWEKIDLVLNHNGFVQKIPFDSNLFKNSDLIDEERKIYELLSFDREEWENPKSYQMIYDKEQSEADEAQ